MTTHRNCKVGMVMNVEGWVKEAVSWRYARTRTHPLMPTLTCVYADDQQDVHNTSTAPCGDNVLLTMVSMRYDVQVELDGSGWGEGDEEGLGRRAGLYNSAIAAKIRRGYDRDKIYPI